MNDRGLVVRYVDMPYVFLYSLPKLQSLPVEKKEILPKVQNTAVDHRTLPAGTGTMGQQKVTSHNVRIAIKQPQANTSHSKPFSKRVVSPVDGHNQITSGRSEEMLANSSDPMLWADWTRADSTEPESDAHHQAREADHGSATAPFIDTIPQLFDPEIQADARRWLLKT